MPGSPCTIQFAMASPAPPEGFPTVSAWGEGFGRYLASGSPSFYEHLPFLNGDAQSLPLSDGSADVVSIALY